LHPETKAASAGANARWNANDKLSFASSTADAIGKDNRSIERAAARGEVLGDDLAAVTGTSLDKGVELDAQPLCSLDVILIAEAARSAARKNSVRRGTSCH